MKGLHELLWGSIEGSLAARSAVVVGLALVYRGYGCGPLIDFRATNRNIDHSLYTLFLVYVVLMRIVYCSTTQNSIPVFSCLTSTGREPADFFSRAHDCQRVAALGLVISAFYRQTPRASELTRFNQRQSDVGQAGYHTSIIPLEPPFIMPLPIIPPSM